mgnify:CR=1 FL=1
MNILLLIGGLILILLGANGLTDGAASVAKRFSHPSHRDRSYHRCIRHFRP